MHFLFGEHICNFIFKELFKIRKIFLKNLRKAFSVFLIFKVLRSQVQQLTAKNTEDQNKRQQKSLIQEKAEELRE